MDYNKEILKLVNEDCSNYDIPQLLDYVVRQHKLICELLDRPTGNESNLLNSLWFGYDGSLSQSAYNIWVDQQMIGGAASNIDNVPHYGDGGLSPICAYQGYINQKDTHLERKNE